MKHRFEKTLLFVETGREGEVAERSVAEVRIEVWSKWQNNIQRLLELHIQLVVIVTLGK